MWFFLSLFYHFVRTGRKIVTLICSSSFTLSPWNWLTHLFSLQNLILHILLQLLWTPLLYFGIKLGRNFYKEWNKWKKQWTMHHNHSNKRELNKSVNSFDHPFLQSNRVEFFPRNILNNLWWEISVFCIDFDKYKFIHESSAYSYSHGLQSQSIHFPIYPVDLRFRFVSR